MASNPNRSSRNSSRDRRSSGNSNERSNYSKGKRITDNKKSSKKSISRNNQDQYKVEYYSENNSRGKDLKAKFNRDSRELPDLKNIRNFKNIDFQSSNRGNNFEKLNRPFNSNDRYKSDNFDFRKNRSQGSLINNIDEIKKSPAEDLIWGRHSSQSTLESRRPIHRIWCVQEVRSSSRFLQLLKDAKASGVLVEEVTWARLGQLTGGAVHQGIVLQTAAAETLNLDSLISSCLALDESPLLIALDGLKDPQNLGAIVRSAEALGAHGLVLPQRRSAGLTGSVAKVAVGALEYLPVARVVNLNRSLEQLKNAGFQVIGLAQEGDLTLSEVDFRGPLVVVVGSEDKGISLVTRRYCDQLVRIPLRGVTNSLNASVATSVFLYEVARRGWMKGLSGQAPSPKMVRAKCNSYIDVKKIDSD